MSSKGAKIHYRLRYVSEDKMNKLYQNVSFPCVQCKFDCKNMVSDIEDCENREYRESINEIIEMIKEQNVNLIRFAEDYNLKLNILLDMLRGNMILNYKYYTCICHRLHLRGHDEYDKYKSRFEIDEDDEFTEYNEFENDELLMSEVKEGD